MHISQRGLRLIELFEGFSSKPYWDPYGRVWTRGYGETEGINADSPAISHTAGEERLKTLVERRYEWAIRDLGIELNQNQWDALCSFVWNLGTGIFTGELRAALERRDWKSAAAQMLQYDHAGGQVLPGLQRRRQTEAQLFLTAPAAYQNPDEARWEHEYDQLRGKNGPIARRRRRALQHAMKERILEIIKAADKTGWEKLNRTDRYRKLLARV